MKLGYIFDQLLSGDSIQRRLREEGQESWCVFADNINFFLRLESLANSKNLRNSLKVDRKITMFQRFYIE
jgi:hypothetical protein